MVWIEPAERFVAHLVLVDIERIELDCVNRTLCVRSLICASQEFTGRNQNLIIGETCRACQKCEAK